MRDVKSKTRENRLRRMANRQGMKLHRSPRRDTHALDYDLYALTTLDGGRGNVHEDGPNSIFTLALDEVEEYLTDGSRLVSNSAYSSISEHARATGCKCARCAEAIAHI